MAPTTAPHVLSGKSRLTATASCLRVSRAVGVLLLGSLLLLPPQQAHALEVTPSADGGFITAWWCRDSVSGRRDAEVLASPLGEGRWELVVSEGPSVDAGKSRRPGRRRATWFAVELVADQPIDARLKVGADGALGVWLDGKEISQHERPYYLLWDDHVVPLKLSAGRHRLLLRTSRKSKQRNAGWSVVARIHDEQGRHPDGLHIHLPKAKAEAVFADAARLRTTRTLTREGYQLTIAVDVAGSVPVTGKLAWTAAIRQTTLAEGIVGSPSQTVPLERGDGQYDLVVTAGSRTWRERQLLNRDWNRALLEATDDLAAARGLSVSVMDSIQYGIDKLRGHILENIPDRKWLGEQIQLVRGWARAARDGQAPFAAQRGSFYRAYRSPYDGRLQPYSVHVPPRYDRSTRWPLVIGMHGIGSGSHYTLRRVLGKDRDKENGEPGGKPLIRGNMPRLPDYGVLTASVWGYHNSAYWFYGENDVLRVIDEMKANYRVDPDRVYLTGLSLGGLGTYHVGSHFPDRFAALGPLGGFSSVKLYRQIRNHKKRWWEKVLIEQRDATTYAENGRHTPMKVVHGRKDAPRHATAMTDRYERLGYKVELDIPDLGHDVWQYSYGGGALIRWMKRYKRPTNPDHITFKTHSYRYTEAYWAKVGWIDDYLRPALLDLRITGKDRRTIRFDKLDNLRGVTLDLTRPKLGAAPIRVVLPGGKTLEAPKTVVHLRREGSGAWTLGTSAEPPAGYKRPGVSGPLDDIMYEPHTFVVGTGDARQTDTNRRLIAEDRSYLRHRNHDIWFPVVDDTALPAADRETKHLVLYGNPASNAVLRAMLDTGKIPLRFEENAIVVDGKRFEGADVGVKMVVPNPFNPDRMVVIVAGVTERGTLLSRYLPRFLPDVIVYDERVASRYVERILIDRPVRYANFFRSDWTLPPARK